MILQFKFYLRELWKKITKYYAMSYLLSTHPIFFTNPLLNCIMEKNTNIQNSTFFSSSFNNNNKKIKKGENITEKIKNQRPKSARRLEKASDKA